MLYLLLTCHVLVTGMSCCAGQILYLALLILISRVLYLPLTYYVLVTGMSCCAGQILYLELLCASHVLDILKGLYMEVSNN